MNIEQLLPIQTEFIDSYSQSINNGKSLLSSSRIIFACLVRNLEPKITSNIQKLVNIGNLARDYRILIYENDSIDNTKSILQELSTQNSKIITLIQNNYRPQFGTIKDVGRTEALAEYRNILKEYIASHFKDYDLVIVADLDFVDFSEAGVYNSLGWLSRYSHIDAVVGNSFEYRELHPGQSKTLWNYDSWAFRHTWWHELSQLDSINYDPMLWFGFYIMPVGSSVVPVNSAFGGMGIYKLTQYIQGAYKGYDCEHVTFHYDLKQIIKPKFQLVLNPSQIMLV